MKQHEPLTFRVPLLPTATPKEESAQFFLQDRRAYTPHVLGSLYGAHLQITTVKANTAKKAMEAVAFLMTWSAKSAPDLPLQLAKGQPMTLTQCRAFTAWLKARTGIGQSGVAPEAADTFNATVAGVRRFAEWAVIEAHAGNASEMNAALDAHSRVWSLVKLLPVSKLRLAEDLEDDEIGEIETFLRHAAEAGSTDNRSAARDYLMWRLAIEYGLRISEILALRLEDLPSMTRDYLKITRTEERGDLVDPRGSAAPQVKTLGRDLGYFFRNTRFPELFNTYQAGHRWVWARRRSGARYQRTRFAHPYLVINTTDGSPLSVKSAEARASLIREQTGIDFHWHKARHAFFNRAYVGMLAIADPYEREERRAGLVYWGGWISESSLDIYTQTARRNQGRRGAFALEGSENKPTWEVLQ